MIQKRNENNYQTKVMQDCLKLSKTEEKKIKNKLN